MSRLFSGKVIFYFFLLLILDVSVMPRFGAFRPVLIYLWVLYVAFQTPPSLFPAAIFAGILRDLVSSQPLGTETVALGIVASLLAFALQKLEHELLPMRMAVAVIFIFSGLMFNLSLANFLSSAPQFSWAMMVSCFRSALVSALLLPFFFRITHRWFQGEAGSRGLRQYELFNA